MNLKNLCIMLSIMACASQLQAMDANNMSGNGEESLESLGADLRICEERLLEIRAETDAIMASQPIVLKRARDNSVKLQIASVTRKALKRKMKRKPGSQTPLPCPDVHTSQEKEEFDYPFSQRNLTDIELELYLYALRNNDFSRWTREEQERTQAVVNQVTYQANYNAQYETRRNANTQYDLLPN